MSDRPFSLSAQNRRATAANKPVQRPVTRLNRGVNRLQKRVGKPNPFRVGKKARSGYMAVYERNLKGRAFPFWRGSGKTRNSVEGLVA